MVAGTEQPFVAPTPRAPQRLGGVGFLGLVGKVGVAATLLIAKLAQGLGATLSPVEPVAARLDLA